MAYINVDLEDFDTDDLIEELEYRGKSYEAVPSNVLNQVRSIYQARRNGLDYQAELDSLIWNVLGRI